MMVESTVMSDCTDNLLLEPMTSRFDRTGWAFIHHATNAEQERQQAWQEQVFWRPVPRPTVLLIRSTLAKWQRSL
jgi:hypothetical protein